MEAMSFVTEDRKPAQESTFPNTYTFDLFGGVDVSSDSVMSSLKSSLRFWPLKNYNENDGNTNEQTMNNALLKSNTVLVIIS